MLGTDPAAAGASSATGSASCCSRRASRPSSTSAKRSSCTGAVPRRRARRRGDRARRARGKVDARIGTLSGGQQRRLDLALGIIGRPDVLFLDEPTTGFDAAARRRSWDLIESSCGCGTTVLLTTHYLDEAEHLADRVGVLAAGRLIAEGTPAELIGRETAARWCRSPLVGARGRAMPGDVDAGAAEVQRPTRRVHDRPIRRPTSHAVTGWALGTRARTRRAVGHPSDARGRVPRSRRRSTPTDGCRGRRSGRERWPVDTGLVVRQTASQLLTFWRTPIAMFFTLVLPLVMLVLFNALFGDGRSRPRRAVADQPVLHRRAGGVHGVSAPRTPTSPTWCRSAAKRACSSVGAARRCRRGATWPASSVRRRAGLVGAGIMLALGVVAYDLDIDAAKMPAMVVTFLVGVSSFSALGMAVAGLVPDARSAAAVANATILPLAFVSNVFIPIEDPPRWLETSATSSRSSRSSRASRTRSIRRSRRRVRLGRLRVRGAVGDRRPRRRAHDVPVEPTTCGPDRSPGGARPPTVEPRATSTARRALAVGTSPPLPVVVRVGGPVGGRFSRNASRPSAASSVP